MQRLLPQRSCPFLAQSVLRGRILSFHPTYQSSLPASQLFGAAFNHCSPGVAPGWRYVALETMSSEAGRTPPPGKEADDSLKIEGAHGVTLQRASR